MLIDIIIPVYKGWTETRRCIESVLATVPRQSSEVVVIDDRSPEPQLRAYLEELASGGSIRLLKNSTNRGFVATANRGMQLHLDRDVVLLNSDTEVAGDWVSRLIRAATSAPDIGTVTPFSNNATICSYPYDGWFGELPGNLGLERLDALFAEINRGKVVDIPTAVGFCMYIRRSCLNQVGLFDEVTFDRGYGEENDFCMRAAGVGWRNVLATDVFVYHKGSVSFGDERFALQKTATERLLAKHPAYLQQVMDFISRDPVASYRSRINAARAAIDCHEAAQVASELAAGQQH